MNSDASGQSERSIESLGTADSSATPTARFVYWLPLILAVAAVLRIIAAFGVQYVAQRRGSVCLFGDTPIYWLYGKAIAEGAPYVVHQWDVPHYALRTPGYPLWLAANMTVFGESALPIRLGQALLGVVMVWWIYRLGRAVGCSERSSLWSAGLVAVDPFQVGLCTLILSESLFTPLLVLFVLLLVRTLGWLGNSALSAGEHAEFVAVGALQAFLGLVRPSWLAFLPVAAGMLTVRAFMLHGFRKAVLVSSAVVFGWGVVTAPWAIRNEQRIDRLAIGGTWGGATLYDSVRPGATGASEMSFVADPQFRDLGETEQDDLWKRLSLEAIKAQPGRIAELAIEKQKRFWSPWPNDSARLPLVGKFVSAAVILPVWVAMVAGLVRNRRRAWPYVVISPLVVTALTHLLFVGSSRYRMAVIVPAMILAGEATELAIRAFARRKSESASSSDQSPTC